MHSSLRSLTENLSELVKGRVVEMIETLQINHFSYASSYGR